VVLLEAEEILMQVAEEMTLTSTTRKFVLALLLLAFVSSASADCHDKDASSFENNNFFQIPEIDSQFELGTKLVAPFLLITIIFQIGIQRALMFTLDEDGSKWFGRDPQYEKQRKKIKQQSTVMALVIAGMLIPTQAFEIIRSWISIVYGSVAVLFFAAILGGFFLLLIRKAF
jgi:hypothetical protein